MFDPNDPEFRRSAIPASTYANRAFVTIVDGVARISFGDAAAQAGETNYHTAVSMNPMDALALADAIYRTFDEAYPPLPPPPPPNPQPARRLGEDPIAQAEAWRKKHDRG